MAMADPSPVAPSPDDVPYPAPRPVSRPVRDDVLDAAREVFLEHGFHGATVEAIAHRAGYSKGAVYSNFESKTDLFLALLLDGAVARAGQLAVAEADREEPSAADVSPEERCDRVALAVARAIITVAEEGRPARLLAEFRAFAATSSTAREKVRSSSHDVTGALAGWLDDGLRARGLRTIVPIEDAARVALGLIQGLAVQGTAAGGVQVRAETVAAGLRRFIAPAEPVS